MVFSLQTGVLLIFSTDVMIFAMLTSMIGLTVESLDFASNNRGSSLGFTIMTDGIVLVLFFLRLLAGLRYVCSVMVPPKMDYQYLMEFGKLRWHTKRVKNMRIYFKNYALASNVSSSFIFIQTLILFLALYGDHGVYFRYAFLLAMSLFTLVNLWTVNSHLAELDEQVTFRIRKYSDAVNAKERKNYADQDFQASRQ